MLILADDLTGAADAAAAFAQGGRPTYIVLSPADAPIAALDTDVVSVDVDSRAMDEGDAVAATAAAFARHSRHAADGVLVKIDSTMRGHVRRTVETVLALLPTRPSRVVVCPAFPSLGRTVVDGAVHVDGEAIPGGLLRERFGGFPAGAGLFIAAAQTEAQIAAIVTMMDDDVLWVGSAGLARHVAARCAPAFGVAMIDREPSAKVVVVVGSQHARSIEQLGRLDASTKVLRVDPRDRAFLEQARVTIAAADGLVLTGGHTARAVLDLLGITNYVLGGEIETGIPWGVANDDGRSLLLVTKAGGFGDVDSLRRAVDFLGSPN
ncbi:MAG: four-carbon acid sugar kinase family protein [Ilumatobacteraceae bacterium]